MDVKILSINRSADSHHNPAFHEELAEHEKLKAEWLAAQAKAAAGEDIEVPDEPVFEPTQPSTKPMDVIRFEWEGVQDLAYVDVGATEAEMKAAIKDVIENHTKALKTREAKRWEPGTEIKL